MLERHPELAKPTRMDPDHAAFVAGYMVHLWLDQLWIRGIFQPYFASIKALGKFRQRLIEHNLLRAHLDRLDRPRLPSDLHEVLARVEPKDWLTFAPDRQIVNWRDHLTSQLAPDGHYRTEEVFAHRLGISAQKFKRQLDSEAHMSYILRKVMPDNALSEFRRCGLAHMAELLHYYMEDRAKSAPVTGRPVPTLLADGSQRTGEDHAHHRAI